MSGRPLRHIALTVQQVTGGYAWLLFEGTNGRLVVLERGARPYRSYMLALQAGYEQLALLSASGLHERGIAHAPCATPREPVAKALELVEFE